VADASNETYLGEYEEVLKELNRVYGGRLVYILNIGRSGSVNARNKLLKLASEEKCGYVIMADDDYILPNPEFPLRMALWFHANREVGAVGGRVIMLNRRRVDPDFFLNTPIPIADPLTKALGYIFLDVRNGPRYAEYLTHFFMIRGGLANVVKYDEVYGGTGFREESDLHEQIKRLGHKLLLDPRVYVYHIGIEYGGDRVEMSMGRRMYWKARNHAKFISKHHGQPLKTWYLFMSAMLLILYRPWYLREIVKGISDGLRA
ncbi:MAG: glycosyltransferase family 2 protein, partial [Sulfolobales archaeon]